MSRHEAFNQSGLSKFLNSPAGRIFRLVAGTGFLVVGYIYRDHALGVLSMAWGALPLSAGALDICCISAVLGGPLSGAKTRRKYKIGQVLQVNPTVGDRSRCHSGSVARRSRQTDRPSLWPGGLHLGAVRLRE